MSIRASFSYETGNFFCCGYAGTKLLATESGVRRRSREDASHLKPDLREHLAPHDRRRPVRARGARQKTQANPAPKGQWETAAIFRIRALKRRSANLFSE